MKSKPAGHNKRDFDWAAINQRIAEISERLTRADEIDPETTEAIWKQRAAQLARVIDTDEQEEQVELVLVRIGREVYGLDAQYVNSIRPQEHITRVPRTPNWLTGVVNVRGRILAAISLDRLFGLPVAETQPGAALSGTQFLVMVETPEELARTLKPAETGPIQAALVVEDVLAVEMIPLSRIQVDGELFHGYRSDYVRGVITSGEAASKEGADTQPEMDNQPVKWSSDERMIVVLNLGAILSAQQLIVNEEIV
jgi:purine-binding chemotaxis protein CheW